MQFMKKRMNLKWYNPRKDENMEKTIQPFQNDERLDDNYRNLAFSIVEQAIREYINKTIIIKKHPYSHYEMKEYKETKEFLLSSWCYELLNCQNNQIPEITGEMLLHYLDKRIEEKLQKKEPINQEITIHELKERVLEDEERKTC